MSKVQRTGIKTFPKSSSEIIEELHANRIGKKLAKRILPNKSYKKLNKTWSRVRKDDLGSYIKSAISIGFPRISRIVGLDNQLTQLQKEANSATRLAKTNQLTNSQKQKYLKNNVTAGIIGTTPKYVEKRITKYLAKHPSFKKTKVRFINKPGKNPSYSWTVAKGGKIKRRTLVAGQTNHTFHELGHMFREERVKPIKIKARKRSK